MKGRVTVVGIREKSVIGLMRGITLRVDEVTRGEKGDKRVVARPLPAIPEPALQEAEDSRGLSAALRPGGLRMLFQPVVHLGSSQLVGHEALARGPRGSLLEAPEALFAAARRTNRLAELDWACRAAAFRSSLAAAIPSPWRLFVNAEPPTLNSACPLPLIPDWVRAHRELNVVVEITERRLMQRPADLIRVVATLRELGWEIALDDTGANDASVALLPVVQPDIVKLDRPLLGPHLGKSALTAVRAITRYTERSGAVLLAEGIETEDELRRAQDLGAVWGQGFLIGRPEPLDAQPRPPVHTATSAPVSMDRHDAAAGAGAFVALASDGPRLIVSAEWLAGRLDEVCRQAAAAPSASVLLLSFGPDSPLPPQLYRKLDQLQDVCALVWLEMDRPPLHRPAGLRVSARPAHQLGADDVSAVFLSPTSACALGAVRQEDGRYETVVTDDVLRVASVSRLMLRRVPALR